jgi:hypothetical protein
LEDTAVKIKQTGHFMLVAAVFAILFSFGGCINYEQRTKLNYDGSGTMQIHYWANESEVQWLASSNFGFDDPKIRDQYQSEHLTIHSIRVETKDSVRNVFVDLQFDDINRLGDAKGFEKTVMRFEEKNGTKVLNVLLKSDSSSSGLGMDKYKLLYVFEMPGEIIASNATRGDKNTLTWEYRLSDMNRDIHMTSTVKGPSKLSAVFFSILAALAILLAVAAALLVRKTRW